MKSTRSKSSCVKMQKSIEASLDLLPFKILPTQAPPISQDICLYKGMKVEGLVTSVSVTLWVKN